MNKELPEMSLWDHFADLRKALVWSLLAVLLCAGACLTQVKLLWKLLLFPLPEGDLKIINVAPMEALIIDFKISLLFGVFIASPVIFWNAYRFMAPALFEREKKAIFPMVTMSTIFFFAGAAFAFYTVLPLSFSFFQSYSEGVATQTWTQNNYSNFLIRMVMAFSVMFQLPVVSYVLAKFKLITAKFLWQQFRFAIVIIFIIAAVLTPPDVISQSLLALPLLILYVFSIGLVYFTNPTKKEVLPTEKEMDSPKKEVL